MVSDNIRFLYAGIEVSDLKRSLRFYERLGFKVIVRGKMEHGGEWVHPRIPHQAQRLELNYYPQGSRFHIPYKNGSELDHLGFKVRDADAWARKAVKRGGRMVDRVDEEHEWLVYVTDPDGIWIEFIGDPRQRKRRQRLHSQ